MNCIHARRFNFKRSKLVFSGKVASLPCFYPGYGGSRTFTVLRNSCPAGHFYRLTPKCPHFYPIPTLCRGHALTHAVTPCDGARGPRSPRTVPLGARDAPPAGAVRGVFNLCLLFTYFFLIRRHTMPRPDAMIGRSHSRLIPTGAGSCDQWSRVALPSRRTSREGSELGRGACCESAARPRACAASCSGGARALKALWSWR
jgi:hypothetical protein